MDGSSEGEGGRVNPKIPALTDLFAFFTTTQAEKKRDCSGKRRNSSPPPSAPAGQHTSRGTHLPPRISLQGRRGEEGKYTTLILQDKSLFSFFHFIFFVAFSFPCHCAPHTPSLSGQRRRPLVRGLTISSNEDAARLQRRRQDRLSSDPRSG